MGTRSYIGIERDDGSVTYIYCHWDGYPSYNGAILMEHYSDPERLEQLLALGDISSLRPKIEPDGPHGFIEAQPDVVIAYHRERGEKWDGVKPKTAEGLLAVNNRSDTEYSYIWRKSDPDTGRPGFWMYAYKDWSEVDQSLPYEEQERPRWVWSRLTPEACQEAQ